MNMVCGHNVIQDTQAEPFFGLVKPVQPATPIGLKSQQELFLVAALSDVPNLASDKMTISARHDLPPWNQYTDEVVPRWLPANDSASARIETHAR
jgi:hypothetical protein